MSNVFVFTRTGALDSLTDMRYIRGLLERDRVESLVGYLRRKGVAISMYNSLQGDIVGEGFIVEAKNGSALNTSGCDRLIGQIDRYLQSHSDTYRGVIVIFGDVRSDVYKRLVAFQPKSFLQHCEVKVLGVVKK